MDITTDRGMDLSGSGQLSPTIAALSICILNYRTPQLVTDCLASLLLELRENISVVIADSNSGDASISEIAAWLQKNDSRQKCKILPLQTNGGFSAGYNAAMKAARAHSYLLLNSDTVVQPGTVGKLMNAAQQYPKTGIFGPRLEWSDGTPQHSCFRDHSPLSELDFAAKTYPVTKLLQQFVVPLPITNTEIRPPWISFAAVLIRDDVLKTAGMLDEGFFLYFEDSEYCRRARNAGWDIMYVPDARVVHLHGQSTQMENKIIAAKRLPRYYYASRTRYFRLRYGLFGPTLANFGWCLGRLISKSRETFGAKKPHLPETAWKDIWTNWSAPLDVNRSR